MSVRNRKYVWAAITLAATAIIILGGLAYGLSTSTNTFNINNVKLNSIYVLRNTDGIGMNVSFRISNPSNNGLMLRNVKYYVTINGMRVGEVRSNELTLNPSSSKDITLEIRVTNNATLTHIINTLRKGTMNLGITAEGLTPIKWYGIAEFSVRKATAEAASTVNVSQILAAEEKKAVIAQATQPVVGSEEPVIQVISVKWVAHGHTVTEVKSGTKVTLQVLVKALKDMNSTQLNVYIINDYKYLPDITHKYMQTFMKLKKGHYGLYSFTFTAKHHWLLRGYYAEITVTERIIEGSGPPLPVEAVYYKMPNHYPPRLKVKK